MTASLFHRFGLSTAIIILASLHSPGHAQENGKDDPYLWAIRAGGTPNGEKVRSLAVGEDGFIYITGQFDGEADFGEHILVSRGAPDCFIAKISSAGEFVWARQIGGEATERGYGIDADKNGNVFVTGHFQSKSLHFAGKEVANTSEDYDAFTASFDRDGNERWIRTGGGPGYDYGHGLDLMPGGGCVIAGRMAGPASLGGKVLETAEKTSRFFVARYSDGGELIWVKSGGAPTSGSADDVAVDSSGNVWVCGRVSKKATYDGQALGKEDGGSLLAAKISGEDGSLIQATRLGGSAEGHAAGIIPNEVNGGCYLCGAYEGEIQVSSDTIKSVGDKDVLVASIDADGNVEWVRTSGGPGWDLALGIGIDAAGNVLVTGFITEKGEFGQGFPPIAGEEREGFVSSYDHRGKLLWVVENGGPANEINEDVAADKKGNVVNGGGFQTEGTFGRFRLKANASTGRSQDIFVAKFRPPGKAE
ncbi:MAG: SBBP repeat-containing protein [Verrucomicrobiae bacterium]|nr:SBBP repeat-containing protein [Verrucomicrobiae bacterium]